MEFISLQKNGKSNPPSFVVYLKNFMMNGNKTRKVGKLIDDIDKKFRGEAMKFDDNEDLEKKIEDTLSDTAADIEEKNKIRTLQEKEKVKNEIESKLEDTLAEFGLKNEVEAFSEQAEEETGE